MSEPLRVRMRFSISGEYDVPLDSFNEEAYGTLDPQQMAKIDEQQLRDDPGDFCAEATEFIVRVISP